MALQIRVTSPTGANPVVLQNAQNIELFESLSSSDEGISFELPIDDPKYDRNHFYAFFWECWDTETNARLNHGPIHEIAENDTEVQISGPGRSQLLEDKIMSKYTFYWPVVRLLNDIRYENNAASPRTVVTALPPDDADRYDYNAGDAEDRLKWYGLSARTKDNAIDDTITPGLVTDNVRMNAFHVTDNYWTGTDRSDTLIVDFQEMVPVSRLSFLFPWWGGQVRNVTRSYSYDAYYSTQSGGAGFAGPWVKTIGMRQADIVSSGGYPKVTTDKYGGHFYYTDYEDNGHEMQIYPVIGGGDPINARFWKIDVTNTHAYYSDSSAGPLQALDVELNFIDKWTYQCDTLLGTKEIPDRETTVVSDCHASIVELGMYSEIIGRDEISGLAYQQIDDGSTQITYVGSDPTKFRLFNGRQSGGQYASYYSFEPGGRFRKVRVSWTSTGTFDRFFKKDKKATMPWSYFAIVDDRNTVVYRSASSSGSNVDVTLPRYTSKIQLRVQVVSGFAPITIHSVDCWPSETNPFSYNNRFSYTIHAGDSATLHFRGQSFKWFITTPEGMTPAGTAKIELRSRPLTGSWGAWTTLENNFPLPINKYSYCAYEIGPSSGILDPDKIHEIKITNVNGGLVSIDSFAGYWSASWVDFNEDHERFKYRDDTPFWQQIYDQRFSAGSMMKSHRKNASASFDFEGDRFQVLSAKAPKAGKITIMIHSQSALYDPRIAIPGGEANGTKIINLDTASTVVPQYIAFDSNDYFVTSGLPWDKYSVSIIYESKNWNYAYYSVNPINNPLSYVIDCIKCYSGKKSNAIRVGRPVFIDGFSAHTLTGISAKFTNETHLSILKAVTEVIQHEWQITDQGLKVVPRIGSDTQEILNAGTANVIRSDITMDAQKVATQLYATGGEIDGLPLFTITEDKTNRAIMGRTIMRTQDYRNLADYFSLVGISRTELNRRRVPEQRITITHVGKINFGLGDSFILRTRTREERVRLIKLTKNQSNDGLVNTLECITWPQGVQEDVEYAYNGVWQRDWVPEFWPPGPIT